MKHSLFLFQFLLLFHTCFTQNDYRKRAALGSHVFLNDFKPTSKQSKVGLALSYIEGLNNHFDVIVTTSGSFMDYPIKNQAPFGENNLLLELSTNVNLKLNTDKHWFTPFITAGAGVSKYKNYYGAFIPAGAGIQVNYKEDIYLLLSSQYFTAITQNETSHFYHSIGIAGNIVKKKAQRRKIVIPVPQPINELNRDRDGDGILDTEDRCPDIPGMAIYKGCPDRDGDGIADIDDQCPDVKGITRYKGCPIPDTDNDGINDEEDKCITLPGVLRYQGCPIPDTDNDGTNDERDSCILQPGLVSNNGCPEISRALIDKINIAAKNIFFKTGSSELLSKSFNALNEVAKILKENTSYKLSIEGHTDNIGTAESNMDLSNNRAKTVLLYLKNKGIDEKRMNAIGYGLSRPIDNNNSVEGRSKNRRVEMTISSY